MIDGAGRICATLRELGVDHVFGLPGTQNVALFEALRRNGPRVVVPADEAAAAFMACGYARAGGRAGVLTTIPGPGFVHGLAGVAEARHDSTPLVWLTLRPTDSGRAFQLQRIDQAAMAAPVVKSCLLVEAGADLDPTLREAHARALDEEPGPVLVEIAAAVLDQPAPGGAAGRASGPTGRPDVQALAARLASSSRPLIFAGQGAQGAPEALLGLARRLGAPVLMTCSGRGVIPDTDPLAFVRDFSFGVGRSLPALVEAADLILALGCKLTHNGSAGGELDLPRHKLCRVDSSAAVLDANYPASLRLHARVEDVLGALSGIDLGGRRWSDDELEGWRARLRDEQREPVEHEPVLAGAGGATVGPFFGALAEALGARAVYVADAGLHQALTRRHAVILRSRGLLCPSDFQSMGFGLPGAIGAALARPEACVVACVGDAGLLLSMGDLTTAVRLGLNLVLVVFHDGQMGLIRRLQVERFGHPWGVDLRVPDLSRLASAVGCSYFPAGADAGQALAQVACTPGVRLVELRLDDASSFRLRQARCVVREGVRPLVPRALWRALARVLRGRGARREEPRALTGPATCD
jgi:acetolactate synthase-1/2/3 large subunit